MKTNITPPVDSGRALGQLPAWLIQNAGQCMRRLSPPRLVPVFGALAACLTVGATPLLASEPPLPSPDVSRAYASPDCLWPPNHKFVPIEIKGIPKTVCFWGKHYPVTVKVCRITSDEPTASIEGAGGKNHAPDASFDKCGILVRAERSGGGDPECPGPGNGRVYKIHFEASICLPWTMTLTGNGNGNGTHISIPGCVSVKVPHDQSNKECCDAYDDGQRYDATKCN